VRRRNYQQISINLSGNWAQLQLLDAVSSCQLQRVQTKPLEDCVWKKWPPPKLQVVHFWAPLFLLVEFPAPKEEQETLCHSGSVFPPFELSFGSLKCTATKWKAADP